MSEEERADQVELHETACKLECKQAEFCAGSDIALKASLSCPESCNLQGSQVRISDNEGASLEEIELVLFDGTVNETDEFVLQAPTKLGEYTWTAVFSAQQERGVLHQGSSATFAFTVKPHATSMAVWDLPSPVVSGARFKLKVGVRCFGACNLTGKEIEICDHERARVAGGTLGEVPRSGTTALYWTVVDAEAPAVEGSYKWTAKFPKEALQPPHEGAAYSFSFRVARPPENVLTVQVTDRDTKKPLKGAQVTLFSGGTTYRSHTDDSGVTSVSVPKGEYELFLFMSDYAVSRPTIEVTKDETVKFGLMYWPEDH